MVTVLNCKDKIIFPKVHNFVDHKIVNSYKHLFFKCHQYLIFQNFGHKTVLKTENAIY